MSMVTVFRDKFARSWPEREKPLRCTDRAEVLSLGEALDRSYPTDAHFAAYVTSNGHRLNCDVFAQGVSVELTCIVFDIDGPGHAATREWRRELREKVCALAEVHPRPFYYETRGGARIVYRQAEPTILRSREDGDEWSSLYLVAVEHMKRRFDIEADPACKDWQRLYRLPHATRDAGGEPENWPAYHNVDDIGSLVIEADWADVDRAKASSPKAFRKARELVFTAGGGDGLLFQLLRARGDVGGEAPRGGWICHCPNRSQHTVASDGTDSTIVYPAGYRAATGEATDLGHIHCLHTHCESFSPRDWLRFFSDAEIEAARRIVGRAA